MAYLTGIITALSMATFVGIIAWAWSRARQPANRASALIPFALPEEFHAPQAGKGRPHE
ncbi:CcoQ/FixQ family Cbb3-type cytochrome c oxidase assembly chaperone [Bordetella genomosp. 9]|uniref:CcoQ/FixQ family Cbb3-type cytochrome c oxidase assembly chaperone n=1 Tax=Bordetella genomosp. 9 TaxID=1416803 RepID=A0A261R2H9_9BORD|nr:CcoQ/FixQ family Cbb3-type cytochrome c oxidase assembly chaperone [Bordetella genomosp. 9]OZI18852.1 CcoQ/FixQ family Cbb3-type cytochrome c oxidase assembly chaperone [Bordetella genomosp. 9]